MFWCDPETGLSEHAWGRATGWYAVALVEVLDYLPKTHPGHAVLVDQLNYLLEVLPKWADPQTGMWYQVLDCPERKGNYQEATCSIMFTYAFLKGLRKGYIDDSHADYIKGLVPEDLASVFDATYGLDYAAIVKGVYKSEAPSRFVASFARFVFENRDNEYAARLLERNLRDFMERSLVRYGKSEVGVVGSFGHACRKELESLGQEYGLNFIKFVKSPIDALVDYHLSK